jgi:hypothetical protein
MFNEMKVVKRSMWCNVKMERYDSVMYIGNAVTRELQAYSIMKRENENGMITKQAWRDRRINTW